jgi:hypothetical protein
MHDAFRHRAHHRGELIHTTLTGAFLTSGALLLSLIIVLILYFGVFLSNAG